MSSQKEDLRAKEIQRRWGNAYNFLPKVEKNHPLLAKQLPGLLTRLVGENTFDPRLMRQYESWVGIGMGVLGDWLAEAGFEGFQHGNTVAKSIAKLKVEMPNRDTFFRTSGIDPLLWTELQTAMVEFSRTIGQALEVGYTPKQIVGGIFLTSTSEQANAGGSSLMREQLRKLSGNRLGEVNVILDRWMQGQ